MKHIVKTLRIALTWDLQIRSRRIMVTGYRTNWYWSQDDREWVSVSTPAGMVSRQRTKMNFELQSTFLPQCILVVDDEPQVCEVLADARRCRGIQWILQKTASMQSKESKITTTQSS